MKNYLHGRFGGKHDSSQSVNLLHILKWKLFRKPSYSGTKKKVKPLEVIDESSRLEQKEDFICWLSHASFLIQLGGKRLLIDPVFEDIPFYKRQIPAPYSPEILGNIDYLLISHVHYDHFDKNAIEAVAAKKSHALLPLKMSKILPKADAFTTTELDWYESYSDGELSITLVPAKHWGRRGIFDRNRVLWGGYVLTYKDKSIFFCGDSAAGEHFKEIGERFNIVYALLPIGAYEPAFIMKHNHLNPQEAYDAFEALNADVMIPMHYGTYKLTDEALDAPLKWIEKISKAHPGKIRIMKAGEVLNITL